MHHHRTNYLPSPRTLLSPGKTYRHKHNPNSNAVIRILLILVQRRRRLFTRPAQKTFCGRVASRPDITKTPTQQLERERRVSNYCTNPFYKRHTLMRDLPSFGVRRDIIFFTKPDNITKSAFLLSVASAKCHLV